MPLTFVPLQRARFSARFPETFRYSPSHYWMAPVDGGARAFGGWASPSLPRGCSASWWTANGRRLSARRSMSGQVVGWVEGVQGGERRLLRDERRLRRGN